MNILTVACERLRRHIYIIHTHHNHQRIMSEAFLIKIPHKGKGIIYIYIHIYNSMKQINNKKSHRNEKKIGEKMMINASSNSQ